MSYTNNPRRSKGLNKRDIKRAVTAWDITTKTVIGKYETITEAAKAFGIKTGSVSSCLKTKGRCHTNNLNKPITFR